MWETARGISGKPERAMRAHTLLHCESFFATLECELIERDTFDTKSEARLSVFEFIEGCTIPIGSILLSDTNHRRTTKKNTAQKIILILKNLIHLSRRESRALSTKAGQLQLTSEANNCAHSRTLIKYLDAEVSRCRNSSPAERKRSPVVFPVPLPLPHALELTFSNDCRAPCSSKTCVRWKFYMR